MVLMEGLVGGSICGRSQTHGNICGMSIDHYYGLQWFSVVSAGCYVFVHDYFHCIFISLRFSHRCHVKALDLALLCRKLNAHGYN